MTRKGKILRAVLAFLVLAPPVWGFLIEPGLTIEREEALVLPGLPEALDGLRVAVLADLHAGAPHMGEARLADIVRRTKALAPDLVLVPGDLVITGVLGGKAIDPDAIGAALEALDAPTYAVLGNHDMWSDGPRVEKGLTRHGIPVLTDAAVRVETRKGPVWIAGFGDKWTQAPRPRATIAPIPEDEPIIAFTHNPDVFPDVPARVVLTVAAHTHGGQVALPFYGALWVPSEFGTRYVKGHVVEDGKHLFVGTGLGTSILPVRFNVPPELPLLVLHPARRQGP